MAFHKVHFTHIYIYICIALAQKCKCFKKDVISSTEACRFVLKESSGTCRSTPAAYIETGSNHGVRHPPMRLTKFRLHTRGRGSGRREGQGPVGGVKTAVGQAK